MSAGWRYRRRPWSSPTGPDRPHRGTQRPVGVALLQRLFMPLVVQEVEHREHQQQCIARAQHQRLPAKHLHPERGRRPAASCAPGPRREQGPLHGGRRGRQRPGKRARGQSSRRAAAHHSRGRRRGGGGPAAREGDAAGRLRAPGLGPPIRGGRGGRGGWSPAPRAGSPMAAAPRTWSGGCASERPRIPDRRTVRLALSSVSLRFSSARGPQAFEAAAGLRRPSPRQSFPAAGALHPGRGNFHRARSPALRSTERGASRLQRRLLQSLGTAASLPALGHEAGRRRQWGVAYLCPSSRLFCSPSCSLGLHIANLPIPPAVANRVQSGPAAAAASSITRRMSGRAARASPGAPWPQTGPEKTLYG